MKLSTRSRYGLRLMIALASSYGDGPRLLKEIADTEELSEKYLGQLVIPLKSAGFISAVRGAKGGYELDRDPQQISPLDIINVLEGDLFTREESTPASPGSLRAASDLWEQLRKAMTSVLSSMTLAELAENAGEKNSDSLMYSI
ncbi:Rrf2 family transcriptional regulator [Marispirochaeta sp.]|jgi:Rrf2 family transcriptional regulator, cysteine metabolism repressor|uniref:RrF2 family transcriptional regulator n=1 Tax=Marispirochaeta sp. TaxID=2038653 RepID=UPI0029C85AFE|nr:Rrf2 family transcriptional regulator [Marispirochaeta sp.]